ncbi:hypothetical protein [Nocardia huaxiensis]|uniref:Secreted protein n=1 Tax=Nocardia huaxiensis TaxID=2755382 RepID=A0A7D6Z984_9NOCA|nr:hypothetical protein [Nocardia huaxiensis]QLY28138.1 hypothetical protein H0264_22385 [Nocardia huaxiensis]UFS98415.1 hypothetical protein LPY97_11190 [Nocardia huaxiensis]
MPIPGAGLVSRLLSTDAAKFQPTEIDSSFTSFTLDDRVDAFTEHVAELADKIPTANHAPMAEVMAEVNHSARPTSRNLPTSDSIGFLWNKQDSRGTTWIPQGLTGSWDADADGTFGEHRIIAASWYDDKGHHGVNRGSRVTFVNYDNPDKPEYRHVLLVVPDREGGFHAAVSHAGGLAWIGYKLYVADTNAIRVFDLHHIWRTEPDPTQRVIGMKGKKAFAADYRFAIPQLGYYRPPLVTQPLRVSCVSLDRTTSPNTLVTAEYQKDRDGVSSTRPAEARIVRWNLRENDTLESSGTSVRSSAAFVTSRANINGAITHDGEFVLTTSEFDRKPGWIHRAELGKTKRYTKIRLGGPEDLTYRPQDRRMWTLTEYDKRRAVFGIPFASIGR